MSYTPKEMKKIWAKVQRYLKAETFVQERFDELHSYVDQGPPTTEFVNKVRRAIGLPERPTR